jgi:hypothetical protein
MRLCLIQSYEKARKNNGERVRVRWGEGERSRERERACDFSLSQFIAIVSPFFSLFYRFTTALLLLYY